MFLHRKSLIIHNQKRVKNHLAFIKKELFKEVENIVNDDNLPLEYQEAENMGIFKQALKKVLDKNLKLWEN